MMYSSRLVCGQVKLPCGGQLGSRELLYFLLPLVLAATSRAQCESKMLQPPDPSFSKLFGKAVALYDDTLLVGAQNAQGSPSANAGGVYVYERVGGRWVLAQTLAGQEPVHFFGSDMAIDGDRAVVGAAETYSINNYPGSVYFFERQNGDWRQVGRFLSDAEEPVAFGLSVAISGRFALAGAPGKSDGNPKGVARLFEHTALGWGATATLEAPEHPSGSLGDSFGKAVALDGRVAVVAAEGDGPLGGFGQPLGVVYVFEYFGGAWVLVDRLVSDDPLQQAAFGRDVALSGDHLLVGSPEGVYAFRRRAGGGWVKVQKIVEPVDAVPGDAGFGQVLSLWGDRALIGTINCPTRPPSGDHAYLLEFDGAQWVTRRRIGSPLRAAGSCFADAVSLHRGEFAISAPMAPVGGASSAGVASVWTDCPW